VESPGFIPLDENVGKSKEGLPLNLWCYRLSHDDELRPWTAEEVEDVVIDAQISYDFAEPDTSKSLSSKGLRNNRIYNWFVWSELHV
jgi:hypothetical protein